MSKSFLKPVFFVPFEYTESPGGSRLQGGSHYRS